MPFCFGKKAYHVVNLSPLNSPAFKKSANRIDAIVPYLITLKSHTLKNIGLFIADSDF
jgi:hypothetical protein